MIMHVITNYTAHAGAEAMLSRLLRTHADPACVVSLIDISDDNRRIRETRPIQFETLQAHSATGLSTAVFRLARLIRQYQPDVILCWMYHAMAAGLLARIASTTSIPVYWNVRQSLDDVAALSRNTRLALAASRSLSRRPAGIIFNSARSLKLHQDFGYRNGNMAVIPNGFEPAAAAPASQPHSPRVFGIAARLHRQKDHPTFFRAAALLHRQHPDIRFVAVGSGLEPDNTEIHEMLAATGLGGSAIELRGEQSDMDDFYRSIDFLVLSSRTEGFPNVIAEAMSYGKPVVTTDVGDAAAVVGDTGIVVQASNPSALAEGMRHMAEMEPQVYARLSSAARTRITEHYSLPHIAERYASFLGH